MRAIALCSLAVLVAATGSACKSPAAGVFLSMSTDMTVPANVETVGVYLAYTGADGVTHDESWEVAPIAVGDEFKVRFPATLGVQSNGDAKTSLRTRVVAYQNVNGTRIPLVMREARMQVPTDRVAVLALPLLWMNGDDTNDAAPQAGGPLDNVGTQGSVDGFARFVSAACGADQTLGNDGSCRSIDIDSSTLPTYDDSAGDAGPRETVTNAGTCVQSACFAVDTCFASDADPNYAPVLGTIQPFPLDGDSACGVPLGAVAQGAPANTLNVAVKTRSGGVCGASGCYVVLDAAASGYTVKKAADGTPWAVLPPGICRRSRKDQAKAEADRVILGVVVSPTCLTKPADQPFCNGAWQTDDSTGGCADGHGWDGTGHKDAPVGDSDAGDASTVNAPCMDMTAGPNGLAVLSDGRLVTVESGGTIVAYSNAVFEAGCMVSATRSVLSAAPAPGLGATFFFVQPSNSDRTAFSAVPYGVTSSDNARVVAASGIYSYGEGSDAADTSAYGAYALDLADGPKGFVGALLPTIFNQQGFLQPDVAGSTRTEVTLPGAIELTNLMRGPSGTVYLAYNTLDGTIWSAHYCQITTAATIPIVCSELPRTLSPFAASKLATLQGTGTRPSVLGSHTNSGNDVWLGDLESGTTVQLPGQASGDNYLVGGEKAFFVGINDVGVSRVVPGTLATTSIDVGLPSQHNVAGLDVVIGATTRMLYVLDAQYSDNGTAPPIVIGHVRRVELDADENVIASSVGGKDGGTDGGKGDSGVQTPLDSGTINGP